MTISRQFQGRLNIYRSLDAREYIFVELAEVDPGHYVAWGQLRRSNAHDARVVAFELVKKSLQEFSSRDGNDHSGRLKTNGLQALLSECDLIAVIAESFSSVALVPYSGESPQRSRLSERAVVVEMSGDAASFWNALEEAFSKCSTVGGN